jgi:hypothetical protein
MGREEVRREFLATGNYAWPPTTGNAYGRSFLKKALPLPLDHNHDGALNTIAPLFGEVRTIPRTLGCYRIHGTNSWAISSAEPTRFAAFIKQKQKEMAFVRKYAAEAGVALPEGNVLDRLPEYVGLRLCALKLDLGLPGAGRGQQRTVGPPRRQAPFSSGRGGSPPARSFCLDCGIGDVVWGGGAHVDRAKVRQVDKAETRQLGLEISAPSWAADLRKAIGVSLSRVASCRFTPFSLAPLTPVFAASISKCS